MIGDSLLELYVEMGLLQVCGPFFMVIIMQLPLCLHKLKILVICVDDHLLPHNIMLPLMTGLDNGIHFFVINGILSNCV